MENRVFISTPRRSNATPNATGTYALYTLSRYSLESHTEGKEIRVLNLETGRAALFSDNTNNKEPTWLEGNQVIWLSGKGEGATEIWIGNAGEGDKK